MSFGDLEPILGPAGLLTLAAGPSGRQELNELTDAIHSVYRVSATTPARYLTLIIVFFTFNGSGFHRGVRGKYELFLIVSYEQLEVLLLLLFKVF